MKRPVLIVSGLLAAAALTAGPASAAVGPNPPAPTAPAPIGLLPGASVPAVVDGGTTSLNLEPRIVRALGASGIAVRPIAPATATGSAFAIPIQSGRVDPDSGAGRLSHAGGLTITRGRRQVRLTDFGITAANGTSTVDARVDGRFRLPILRLVTQRATVESTATTTKISSLAIHLSRFGAVALNRSLHTRAFRPAVRLGAATIQAQRAQVTLAGGTTSLALDPAAAAALDALGIAVAPIAPASSTPEGALAFPILGGTLRARDLAGQVRHAGGLAFTSADGFELDASDFVIDTVRNVLTAKVGEARVDLLTLDRSSASVMAMGDTLTVGNVGVALTPAAVGALGEAFGIADLPAGLRLGVASINGQVR